MFGNRAIIKRTFDRWYKKFKSEYIYPKNQLSNGRPHKVKEDLLITTVNTNKFNKPPKNLSLITHVKR